MAASITVAGKRVVAIGGSSWGDSPSEAFDAAHDLDGLGVLEAVGFEADEPREGE
jgi:hypothetical protein